MDIDHMKRDISARLYCDGICSSLSLLNWAVKFSFIPILPVVFYYYQTLKKRVRLFYNLKLLDLTYSLTDWLIYSASQYSTPIYYILKLKLSIRTFQEKYQQFYVRFRAGAS